jgi:hypothetical protein
MPADLTAAAAFMAGHARLLDRRRFDLLMGQADAGPALAALDAYRNPDGGYGWGLEPDLRAAGSQPIQALHAFEVMHECKADAALAVELCDWLGTVSLDDGGIPFTLPVADPTACAPWFTASDGTSSLQGTAAVASTAWRVAHHHAAVASHPWLVGATAYCLDTIATRDHLSAYETLFSLHLLDAVHDTHERAPELLARLVAAIPPSGSIPVEGGLADEHLRPLDYAPLPGSPVRAYVAADVVEADLTRIEDGQRDDGGWDVSFASFSPMAGLEWRGYATLTAVALLIENSVL